MHAAIHSGEGVLMDLGSATACKREVCQLPLFTFLTNYSRCSGDCVRMLAALQCQKTGIDYKCSLQQF
jgi:hypothetical protein